MLCICSGYAMNLTLVKWNLLHRGAVPSRAELKLVAAAQRVEKALADQAVKELLRRFSDLEDRKHAGTRAQHRANLQQMNLVRDIHGARASGEYRFADDLALLLSEARASAQRKRVRWRFKRQSMVFLAPPPQGSGVQGDRTAPAEGGAEAGTEEGAVGCCTLILKVLDAALPPPFPTRQPARLYVGNLVVQSRFRRCGYGTALLQAAEKLGWRWRHREIWLHVDENNTPAVEMYLKNGYTVVRRERDPMVPLQWRLLMKKTLPLRSPGPTNEPITSERAGEDAEVQTSKVFVWGRPEP